MSKKVKEVVSESPSRLGNYAQSQRVNSFKVEKNPYLDKVTRTKYVINEKNGLEEVELIKEDREFKKSIFKKDDFRIEVLRRNGVLDSMKVSEGLIGSGTRGEKADAAIDSIDLNNE